MSRSLTRSAQSLLILNDCVRRLDEFIAGIRRERDEVQRHIERHHLDRSTCQLTPDAIDDDGRDLGDRWDGLS